MATIEEMNKVISEYTGFVPDVALCAITYANGEHEEMEIAELRYHTSWDWLMPVWKKLRGELDAITYSDNYEIVEEKTFDLTKEIERAIADLIDLLAAHSLIFEAIVLVTKRKTPIRGY